MYKADLWFASLRDEDAACIRATLLIFQLRSGVYEKVFISKILVKF